MFGNLPSDFRCLSLLKAACQDMMTTCVTSTDEDIVIKSVVAKDTSMDGHHAAHMLRDLNRLFVCTEISSNLIFSMNLLDLLIDQFIDTLIFKMFDRQRSEEASHIKPSLNRGGGL